tara:strand:- start:284 stop:604 length:321 start_codon:yes stop_codon:yes gene_type:complete
VEVHQRQVLLFLLIVLQEKGQVVLIQLFQQLHQQVVVEELLYLLERLEQVVQVVVEVLLLMQLKEQVLQVILLQLVQLKVLPEVTQHLIQEPLCVHQVAVVEVLRQ